MKKFFCFICLTCLTLPAVAQDVLSLDSCRALAIANNKELLIGQEKIKAAHYRKKAAFTSYLPQISATGGYMRNQKEFSAHHSAEKTLFDCAYIRYRRIYAQSKRVFSAE